MHAPAHSALRLAFDAIFYYVTDIERSIAFYRDVLGLPLVSHDYLARFYIDGVLFEIVPARSSAPVSGAGNARLCFSTSDIGETLRELQARGVPTSEAKTEPGGLLAFFRDPDGNELCLWQDAGASTESVVHRQAS